MEGFQTASEEAREGGPNVYGSHGRTKGSRVLQTPNSRGGDEEDREGKQEVICLARVRSSGVWPEDYGE